MTRKFLILAIVFAAALTGCSSGPSVQYTAGNVLLTEDFSNPNAWETFDTGSGHQFGVVNGAYQTRVAPGGYVWGLNNQVHSDVVIEVESRQLSTAENNAYGVMCRAATSNNGDGYYFMISGDGFYSIREGVGDDVEALVDWRSSGAINKGVANNRIRAVCVGDYLALWANGQFMAEVRDTSYTSGYAGFAAAIIQGDEANITFDNLTISEASIASSGR